MSGGPASPASGGGAAPDEPEPHVFFDDPTIDALIATITTLTGELSVVRERLDTVERLLERNGALDRGDIDQFHADATAARERAAKRYELVADVFKTLNRHFEKASRAR